MTAAASGAAVVSGNASNATDALLLSEVENLSQDQLSAVQKVAKLLGIAIPDAGEWMDRLPLLEPMRRFRNTYFVFLDWRLEMGATAELRCNIGHQPGFGDHNIVCGPERTWIARDSGSEFLPLNCIKRENFCPPIDMENGGASLGVI